ncbi:hypothetical protein FQN60_005232 [Etheostoma spectabile]|uniref:Uncharacterized protein n=1 Tax=Etheostoma spectabile TaxID=54343 RepID=A0A5J5DMH3_9PERO|nr:hypothetical protein FQN60_005232 [Etheostoma spectabile]
MNHRHSRHKLVEPSKKLRRTSALVMMSDETCSAVLISSLSVISALWTNIKATTQSSCSRESCTERARGRESSREVAQHPARIQDREKDVKLLQQQARHQSLC